MTEPKITTTHEEVRSIMAIADPTRRKEAEEAFITRRMALFRRFAASFCSIYGVGRQKHFDEDVLSIVAEEAFVMLVEARNDISVLDSVNNWEATLYVRARAKVRRYIDHNADVITGLVSARRRRRIVRQVRIELIRSLQREPSGEEVIAEANRRHQHLKDPARQGMVFTRKDRFGVRSVSLNAPVANRGDEDATELHEVFTVDFAEDYIVHPMEGRKLVDAIIQRAAEVDPMLGRIAQLWTSDAYSLQGEDTDTFSMISRHTGLSRKIVHERIQAIRDIGMQVWWELGLGA